MSTLGAQLSIKGERRTGQDVRTQNVMAASSIANIVKVRITFEYYPISRFKCFCNSLPSLLKSCVNPIIAKIIERIKNAKLAPSRLKML